MPKPGEPHAHLLPEDSYLTSTDFQYHIWSIAQDGELALCPAHKKAKRVFDMGTGTGIWAINFADAFPSAEVIGVDLSPIQPGWVPPNCKFEIDDLEKDWTWDKPFDFIYARALEGCFSDIPKMIEKVYKALSTGGWFEVGSLMMPMGCDDGTVPKNSALARWHDLLTEATAKIGRLYTAIATHTKEMEEAGFVNVKHKDFIWPLNSWPKDEHLSEIGRWHCVNLDLALEAMSLALLTRVMDWSKAEVEVFCANVRKDVRNKKMHAYWKM
ncbi:hypothetical protein CSOJ01_14474 [Colletotrichum sojae]|uniref:Methyltransferase domain-containing protein n=1 Tax=Colletotrichum sojae TaxID=2175907 RepID=A0A8H6IQK4_9PEZI|nr:hypothetical protein CSOJ01_14474 [Colletotrichum sojae]